MVPPYCALSGLDEKHRIPRALPWALIFRPFGAEEFEVPVNGPGAAESLVRRLTSVAISGSIMNAPYLVRMSVAAFDDLPNKVVPRTVRIKDPALESPQATKWILSGYCEKLLYKNEKLQGLFRRFAGRLDAPECRNCLTPGQRI